MNIERAQDMYEQDPVFHNLVDAIYSGMQQMNYTPSEVRAAAMLAAMHFDRQHVRPTRLHLNRKK